MAGKGSGGKGAQVARGGGTAPQGATGRDERIMNLVLNTSVILMSVMLGVVTKALVGVAGAMGSGMAEAFGGEGAKNKMDAEIKQNVGEQMPKVDAKIAAMMADMRKKVYVQFEEKRKEIEPMLSDPAFDAGPQIVEKYDFKLPKLTEEIDDVTLARYAQLLVTEDPNFAKMFKEITAWMNALPKPPEGSPKLAQ